jgi:CHAT domain-containing protein/tetratricopeptide (TPR) repeat protein
MEAPPGPTLRWPDPVHPAFSYRRSNVPMTCKTYSITTLHRIIICSAASVFVLSLLAAPLYAQSDQVTKRDAARKLLNDGQKLRAEGSKESLEAAIPKFEEAQPLFHSLNDQSNEAFVLLAIGRTYSDLGEPDKGLDYSRQALLLYRAAGDRKDEAITINNIAKIYYDVGDRQKALDYFGQALTISRAVGDRQMEALTLDNIGGVYGSLGEKQKALDYHTQALPIYRALGFREGEANALNNIGLIYGDLGEKQKALNYYGQALPIQREIRDREGEGVTLGNLGSTYSDLGEKQKALDYYSQALSLSRTVGDRGAEARVLNNIGTVYYQLGESQKALDYFEPALSLKRAVSDKEGEADLLNNIGAIYSDLGENQKALNSYTQALPLTRAVGDRRGEATTLSNIGMVYRNLGDSQKALDSYAQALSLSRAVDDRDGEGVTLNNLGDIYDTVGDKRKALDYYERALLLFRSVGDRKIEIATLGNIALIERDLGNLSEARAQIETAISTIELLRVQIANRALRASYFSTVQGYYKFYVDLLMRLDKQHPNSGHGEEGLQVSERARARALLDTLSEAGADIRQGVDAKLVEREQVLQRRLNATAQDQMKVLAGPHSEEQAKSLSQQIESLTTEFEQVETEIRQTSPRYAALTQPQPLSAKEIQRELDSDTLLLEYSLGDERSYLWAVTPNSVFSYDLPKGQEIEELARQVYALISDKTAADNAFSAHGPRKTPENDTKQPKTNAATAALGQSKIQAAQDVALPEAVRRLSGMLLDPVAGQLRNKRLLIVADGALQYIPFAVLADNKLLSASGGKPTGNAKELAAHNYLPLIVEHEIVTLPSASSLAVLRQEVKDRKPAAKTVAVLADPVFERDDERVRKVGGSTTSPLSENLPRAGIRGIGLAQASSDSGIKGPDLRIPRLPGTRAEARQILSLVSPAQGKGSFDFAASRQTATSNELSEYRYVHFATHGFLDSLHPELSGIVLSMIDESGNQQDGFLRTHEIFNLKLPAELVVLSACQTGLGKQVKGEGLIGLTRGFMYAGAPRVVVSLWSVNDRATAELMARFYRSMLKENLTPAAALRSAQVSLMKEQAWHSPFYWAAFTLQGEWR